MLLRSFFFLMAFLPLPLFAQQAPPEDLAPDDLQSLLNTPVAVASIKEMTLSESPAILTVITRDDMNRFGLRYLNDIGTIIPGVAFGCDVLGVVGIGIRNNWAHEGKALIMLDGVELNEDLYSNTQFGNHYSLDNIEKIEVIRGPGSVIYGGTAALAVINMISKSPDNGQTVSFNTVLSRTAGGLSERGGSVVVSNGSPRSGFSLYSRYSRDRRSDANYTDINGNSYEMNHLSELENATVHLRGKHNGWLLDLLFDDYSLLSKDGYVDITETASTVGFKSINARLQKSLTAGSQIEITPFVNYKRQAPWSVIYENKTENPDEVINLQKLGAGTNMNWLFNDYHTLSAGIEHWTENASSPENAVLYFEEYNNKFTHQSFTAFVLSTSKLRYWSFSPGVRFSYSSRHYLSLVPRMAVTRIWNWGYSKVIASRSYRNPSIMNMVANPSIKPEYATVFEMETGISIKAFSVLSANVYRMLISDPITYYYDEEAEEDKYINEGKAGTEGVEISFNHHFPTSRLILTGSISQPVRSNNHQLYKAGDQKNYLLGFSPFQFSANYSYQITTGTMVWCALSYNGKKYGITALDAGEPVYSAYNETIIVNTGIKKIVDKSARWSIAASVSNLLNQPVYFIQPYKSYHGALPAKGREFVMTISYQIKK